jgi:hypothetical protein
MAHLKREALWSVYGAVLKVLCMLRQLMMSRTAAEGRRLMSLIHSTPEISERVQQSVMRLAVWKQKDNTLGIFL